MYLTQIIKYFFDISVIANYRFQNINKPIKLLLKQKQICCKENVYSNDNPMCDLLMLIVD